MQHPIQIQNINKKLSELYGKHDDGRPYFRLAWPPDEREKRFGEFNFFIPGTKVFLKTEKGVLDRKKYPYLGERWLLEKLTFPRQQYWTADLIGLWNGSYEPVWYFDGEYRIPHWDALQHLVRCAVYGPDEVKKVTQNDIDEMSRKAFEKEVERNYEILDNETPDIPHALKEGTAIINPWSGNEKHSGLILPGSN